MLTLTKLRFLGRCMMQHISHFSAMHPFGTFLFLFIFPPVGVLVAVALLTILLSIPMVLLGLI